MELWNVSGKGKICYEKLFYHVWIWGENIEENIKEKKLFSLKNSDIIIK